MFRLPTKLSAAALLGASSVLITPVSSMAAASDILFVLDGSGSMWGQIDGVAKITTAKDTMTELLDSVAPDARIGLMTYGTTSKDSCGDVSLLNAIGSDRNAIKESIAGIKPLGKTPISTSLTVGISQLKASQPADTHKALVLVSDGIQTCEGDPCVAAGMGELFGVDMRVHVVGFDVDADARAQLECIAKAGKGQYFNASDTNGFVEAMNAVVEVAQAVEPEPVPEPEPVVEEEPAGPTITEFFREDFDGGELAEHWALENANPDNFIVEGGVLTLLSLSMGGFEAQEPENLFVYTGEMPKGDWDVEVTYTGEYNTHNDRLTIGLRKDEKNYLATQYRAIWTGGGCQKTMMNLTKVTTGKADSQERPFRSSLKGQCYHARPLGGEADWDALLADHMDMPIKLTLSKRGRGYTSKVEMIGFTDPDGNPYVLETDQYTSLRSPGTLSFQADRAKKDYASGEVLMMIDSIVINKVEQ